jgi:SnoaL-like domain
MQRNTSSLQDPITLLQHYQDVCNRYDIDTAVALFADDGSIEIHGTVYRGQAVLRAAHECDMGSQTQVTFSDYAVEGERVSCTFITCDVLDRAVGLDGRHMRAEFIIRDGRIVRFLSLPADEQERQRHGAAKYAFHTWARAHYPDEVAKGANLDYEAGASLGRVVQAWLNRHNRDD